MGKINKVLFIPDNIEVAVETGANLLEAAIAAGVHINASCGGMGVCGTCKVKIEKGSVESSRNEKIPESEYSQGIRQACQSRVLSDLVVMIPVESRLDRAIQARERKKSAGVSASGWKFSPPLRKYFLDLPPATLEDNVSDLFRLQRGLKQSFNLDNLPVDFEVIRKLPEVIRQDNWKITVTTLIVSAKPRSKEKNAPVIINVEAGDTRKRHCALAIDVGTTTVCAQLVDLNRGKILADTITFNKQRSYGADVITRIAYCQKPGGLRKLQEMVVASINEVIDELVAHSRIDLRDIGHITVAGNTTMTHILLGLDPKYLRLTPYTPIANYLPLVKAYTLGIKVPEWAHVYIFPSISSYVGGDVVSGVIASGMHQRKKLTFYMDIGTNGEIVIGNSDWMVTASCSAGPAFEGGGIKHGMVAMNGAIQDFSLEPATLEPLIKTIGDARPKGICGSGLINTIAEFLENGVISQNGKFNLSLSSPRIRQGADGYEYVLAWKDATQIGQDIVITEVDIDNLIRAKAAMYAGCHTLTRAVNTTCADFEQVIIAGNFGNSLNIEKAITIGLLPDIPRERFVFIGNGSLSGARLVNFSIDMLDDARKVAQMMTNIELSENSDFTNNYIAALFLPHTDEKAFPSISEKISKNFKVSGSRS
ncbi:MAG: ferredoxin [Chloroflexi bacterium]|nr:ferredoxin [Chloroflexota bacterium]